MSSSQVLIVLLLILLNGFFVLSEMALVSAKRSRLQSAAEQGQSGAKSAIALLEDPTTLLSVIQIGITLLTIFTGLYGGESFAGPLAEKLRAYGVSPEYTEEVAKTIVVVIITFVTLIIGEIVPKRVALQTKRPGCSAQLLAVEPHTRARRRGHYPDLDRVVVDCACGAGRRCHALRQWRQRGRIDLASLWRTRDQVDAGSASGERRGEQQERRARHAPT